MESKSNLKEYFLSPELTELGASYYPHELEEYIRERMKTPFLVLTAANTQKTYRPYAPAPRKGWDGIAWGDGCRKVGLRCLGEGVNRFAAYSPFFQHKLTVWWYSNPGVEPLKKVPEQDFPAQYRDFGREPFTFAFCCGVKFFEDKPPEEIKAGCRGLVQKTADWVAIRRVVEPSSAALVALAEDGWKVVDSYQEIYFQIRGLDG